MSACSGRWRALLPLVAERQQLVDRPSLLVADAQLHEAKEVRSAVRSPAPQARLSFETSIALVPATARVVADGAAHETTREAVLGAGDDAAREDDQTRARHVLAALAIRAAPVQREPSERFETRGGGCEQCARAHGSGLLAVVADAHIGREALGRLMGERRHTVEEIDRAARRWMVAIGANVGELGRHVEQ